MKKLLITRSRHDLGNQYLYSYSRELIKEAEDHLWQVNRAEDENNNEKEIKTRISKNKPKLVIFNGHGNERTIYGHNDKPAINLDGTRVLDKTIVFARCCGAIKVLGKKAIKEGCIAFIGYTDDFTIPHVNEYAANPLEDPTAKPVLEVSNTVAKSLIKGSSAEEAVENSRKKAEKLILKMLESNEPYDSPALMALIENQEYLKIEGKLNSSG